ncbi:TIGR02391 family protein [Streptomyces sp. WG-D5]
MSTSIQLPEGFPRPSGDSGRLLLQAVFKTHQKDGCWRSPKKLNRLLQKYGTSLSVAMLELPPGLIKGTAKEISVRDWPSEVRLTLAGVVNCGGSDGILRLFFELLGEAAEKEKEESRWTLGRVAICPIESERVKSALGGIRFNNPVDFLMGVVESEPWCVGASAGWSREYETPAVMSVDSRIRFFAGCRNIADYWCKREEFIRNSATLRLGRTLDGMHPDVIAAAGDLWAGGHFTQAVLAVFRCIEFRVQSETGESSDSGQALMARAFSDAGLDVRKADGMSGRSEQAGFKFLYMGAMAGLRNPRAHGDPPKEEEAEAYEAIAFGSLLLRRLDLASRRRGIP